MLTSAGKQDLALSLDVFEFNKHKKNPYELSSFWQSNSRHFRVANKNVSESYLKIIVRIECLLYKASSYQFAYILISSEKLTSQ